MVHVLRRESSHNLEVKFSSISEITDQVFSRLVPESEMVPSWFPSASLSKRRGSGTRSDRTKLLKRSYSAPASSHPFAAATSPSFLDGTQSYYPTTMQSVPESRQQTFEEIYGPPENFLEIEVSRNPSLRYTQTTKLLSFRSTKKAPQQASPSFRIPRISLKHHHPTTPHTNPNKCPPGPQSPNARHIPQHVHLL